MLMLWLINWEHNTGRNAQLSADLQKNNNKKKRIKRAFYKKEDEEGNSLQSSKSFISVILSTGNIVFLRGNW